MFGEPQSSNPVLESFELTNDKTCLKFTKLESQNLNLTEDRTYNQVFLHKKYLCFFGEEIKTLSNILAFDIESLKWITIPIEAPSSKIFIQGSFCHVCPYHSGFFFSISSLPTLMIERIRFPLPVEHVQPDSTSLKAEWSNIPINLPFRRNHSANLLGDRMYMFGGINSTNVLLNNDLTIAHLGI